MGTQASNGHKGLVHFLHGKESGPWGRKIAALAAIASRRGWEVESLDYSHTKDPAERLGQLVRNVPASCAPLVLAGSSMGGWVAVQAAHRLHPAGVFLLAPALCLPGYQVACQGIPAAQVDIVHGWDDEVVPCDDSIRFARAHGHKLHLVADGHRLDASIACLEQLFDAFLARCEATLHIA